MCIRDRYKTYFQNVVVQLLLTCGYIYPQNKVNWYYILCCLHHKTYFVISKAIWENTINCITVLTVVCARARHTWPILTLHKMFRITNVYIKLFNQNGVDNIIPVSYTHLDVYKRQGITFVLRMIYFFITLLRSEVLVSSHFNGRVGTGKPTSWGTTLREDSTFGYSIYVFVFSIAFCVHKTKVVIIKMIARLTPHHRDSISHRDSLAFHPLNWSHITAYSRNMQSPIFFLITNFTTKIQKQAFSLLLL